MGVYDDAARFAAEADPAAFVGRLLAPTRRVLTFERWIDPRTPPMTGTPGRVPDLLAVLRDPDQHEVPWLLGVELQSRPDPEKLPASLEATGNFTARAIVTGGGRYRVTSALVHLTGSAPEDAIDARLGGFGTFHRPIPWNVAFDRAKTVLDGVSAGRLSWAMLFWCPLMDGAETEAIARRWLNIVGRRVSDPALARVLRNVALIFAELSGRALVWQQVLGGYEMTESPLVNGWIAEANEKALVAQGQRHVLRVLELKFPQDVTEVVRVMVRQQSSPPTLERWLDSAVASATFADFVRSLGG